MVVVVVISVVVVVVVVLVDVEVVVVVVVVVHPSDGNEEPIAFELRTFAANFVLLQQPFKFVRNKLESYVHRQLCNSGHDNVFLHFSLRT